MGLLDKITNKPKIDELTAEISSLREAHVDQARQFQLAESMAQQAMYQLRTIKEAKTWGELRTNLMGMGLIEGDNWKGLSIGPTSDDNREMDDDVRNQLREACIACYYKTPEGRAIINNFTNYIIGGGVHWTVQDEDPRVQEFIDEFAEAKGVNFTRRQISIVKRTLRDGELFIHMLTDSKGKTYALRFFPASEITEIETDPNDAEVPVVYVRKWMNDKGVEETKRIKADEIHHIKLNADEDTDRGRPMMENVLRRITQHEDWLAGRIQTNKAKSSIFLEKIVKGSPTRVASVAASLPSTSRLEQDEYAAQAPRYGTVAVHNENIEWKWVEPKIDAADCAEDGRQMRLSIAGGVQMPEYMLTSDASNQNYASSMVAESPFIQAVEAERKFFEEEIKVIFQKVIERGIRGGALPSTSTETAMTESAFRKVNILRKIKENAVDEKQMNEADERIKKAISDEENYETKPVPTNTKVDIEWPQITTRDILRETQAVEAHYTNGWCSKRTAQMKFGYDPDEEERMIAKEKEEKEAEPDAYEDMQAEIERLKGEMAKKGQLLPEGE